MLMMLLTTVLVMGVLISARLKLPSRWRFLVAGLHRNVSLLAVVFLTIHVAAAVLDPFARLGWSDALIPFTSAYRPLWLGLGVVAAELFLALVLSSLVRRFVGSPLWRFLHWAAYASWAIGLVHGLGSGTDAATGWFLVIDGLCVIVGISVVIGVRLVQGWPARAGLRIGLGAAICLGTVGLAAWYASGPSQPGWARLAGTPAGLLNGGREPTPAPSPSQEP